jgi:hypothetical protein
MEIDFVFLQINDNHKIISRRQNLEKNKSRTVVRLFALSAFCSGEVPMYVLPRKMQNPARFLAA